MEIVIHLTLAVVLASSGFASRSPARQEQSSSQAQVTSQQLPNQETPNSEAPKQDQTAPTAPAEAPSVPSQTTSPHAPTPAHAHKAAPAPKPPVLKHRKHNTKKSSASQKNTHAQTSAGDPHKVVVRNGGVKEGSAQLTPAISPAQARYQRTDTANLLAATDANLKRVAGRQLTHDQQSMVDQIRAYMRQAKAAAASSDTNRAQTLAYKAHLLSDELARK
jgi:outer membrane biosynthesis protein TonB